MRTLGIDPEICGELATPKPQANNRRASSSHRFVIRRRETTEGLAAVILCTAMAAHWFLSRRAQ
jgi:hypothetical protein